MLEFLGDVFDSEILSLEEVRLEQIVELLADPM